jgi:hypothetical protein
MTADHAMFGKAEKAYAEVFKKKKIFEELDVMPIVEIGESS